VSRAFLSSGVEELGVVLHVVVHEGVDEEEAVVVALRERHATSRSQHDFKVTTQPNYQKTSEGN